MSFLEQTIQSSSLKPTSQFIQALITEELIYSLPSITLPLISAQVSLKRVAKVGQSPELIKKASGKRS